MHYGKIASVVDFRVTATTSAKALFHVYHIEYNPPRVEDQDDETGEPLVQREDDTEETVRERISVYTEQTAPLVEYYSSKPELRYLAVDGSGDVADIQEAIASGLS